MKVFISADIEGITTTTLWDQASSGKTGYDAACAQMTAEVVAACEGAIAAGADYIRVKDAHGSGTNILPELLPACVELTRSSCGSPWSMVYGIADGFDAAMFIGYHCAAGRNGNPLSHTETTSTIWVKLNGVKCSEFMLYSYAAAYAHVPSVLLAGDQMLVDDSKNLHPKLKTVAVKRGFGGSTTSIQPALALVRIRDAAEAALRQNLTDANICLPSAFELEICYKEHKKAMAMSQFPGFRIVDDNSIALSTRDYWDVLRAIVFVL